MKFIRHEMKTFDSLNFLYDLALTPDLFEFKQQLAGANIDNIRTAFHTVYQFHNPHNRYCVLADERNTLLDFLCSRPHYSKSVIVVYVICQLRHLTINDLLRDGQGDEGDRC